MSSTFTKFFDYKDDKSAKFWEVTQAGSTVTVRYGKTGTNGQTQEKVFADTAAAIKHVEKIISEKTGKGYVEVFDPSSLLQSASNSLGRDSINNSSDRTTQGGSLESFVHAFAPFESSNGAKQAGKFIHYKEITDFAKSVGSLTRESYDYVLEVGDTVDIPQPVFGCCIRRGHCGGNS
jgi:predicted DNA-binding WGR domain protein